jgi:Zn-dependent peptidase ImmA (M78 family)
MEVLNMSRAEERARKLIRELSVTSAPVLVDQIAQKLGIEVKYHPARPDVSGALIREGERAVIAVNDAQHENRQRFTIAHEIGHHELHRSKLYFDEDFSVIFRNSLSSEAKNREEIEANQFAAELLMPRDFIRGDIARYVSSGTDPEVAISALASRYQVSRKAMELRLLNLGYLSPLD